MPEKCAPQHALVDTNRLGIVRYFQSGPIGTQRGFGFIEVPGVKGSGRFGELFVHESQIRVHAYPPLRPGDFVVVDLIQGLKGINAINVRIL